MKMLFSTLARMPGEKAHSSQIAQNCQAFLKAGVDLELLIANRNSSLQPNDISIEKYYNMELEIPRRYIDAIDIFGYLSDKSPRVFLQYAYRILIYSYHKKLISILQETEEEYVFYSRDIHTHYFLSKYMPNVKRILELHDLMEAEGQTRDIEEYVIHNTGGIIANTYLMRQELLNRGVPEYKVLTGGNAVNAKTFPGRMGKNEARSKLKLPINKSIIAYVGNFHTQGLEKGIRLIVDSIKYINNSVKDPFFIFVGGPLEYSEKYIDRLNAIGVDPSLYEFFGRQPYDDIHIWLGAADVLAMPLPNQKLFTKIMSPLKMYEYMTSGRPIVASDMPSLTTVLQNDVNALLPPMDSVEAFSNSVVSLLNDKELADRLGKRAKLDVSKYTWDNRAKRILEWIDSNVL